MSDLREAIAQAAEDAYTAALESDQADASVGGFVADAVLVVVEAYLREHDESDERWCNAFQAGIENARKQEQAVRRAERERIRQRIEALPDAFQQTADDVVWRRDVLEALGGSESVDEPEARNT